jgi:excisionase family DNA binding protein
MATETRVHLDQIAGRATITVTDAAKLLGISRTAAYQAARRGELPTRRLGHRLVVPVPWLLSWLEGR